MLAGKRSRPASAMVSLFDAFCPAMTHWVCQPAQLDALSHTLDAEPLALDTEFIRERTYYPKLALVQLRSSRGEEQLIDPLALPAPGALAGVLQGPALKIMHSPSEDLQALRHGWGLAIAPIFDTQLAAALTGLGAGKSYQALVDAVLGITLEKSETRSDWLQRPLTDSQRRYATEDVRHLHALHAALDQRLGELGRRDWLAEDCARLAETTRQDKPDPHPHLSMRSAQGMDPQAQCRLRRLLLWREHQARASDRPRSWILDNELLVWLAGKPLSRAEFEALLERHPRAPRRNRAALWQALSRPPSPDEHDIPLAAAPDPSLRQALKAMQAEVARQAAELDIPEGLLCARRHLESLLAQRQWPDALNGWRSALLKPALLALLP